MVTDWALNPGFSAAGELPATSSSQQSPSRQPTSSGQRGSSLQPAPPAPSLAGAGNLAGALADASFTPDRLVLPTLGVDAAVVPVALDRGGGLAIPNDAKVIGWWSGGASPGSPVGTVLMAGHVDSAQNGPGALFHLSDVPIGARLTVGGPDGAATYIVRARRRYLKQDLPWSSILAQGEAPRLVLVTCGGDFDFRTRHYTDNVIVLATPA
jgi:hypothetical protein